MSISPMWVIIICCCCCCCSSRTRRLRGFCLGALVDPWAFLLQGDRAIHSRCCTTTKPVALVTHALICEPVLVLEDVRLQMCVSRCLRCVGVCLVPMAIVCILSNLLLLFPELSSRFLLEGHVTCEAAWATGVWGSGFLVLLGARSFVQSSRTRGCCVFRSQMLCQALYSCVSLLGAFICCVASTTGLANGPLCLYDGASGQAWGVPLKPSPGEWSYLYNRTLWSGVCLEPGNVVQWNVVLFSVMGATGGLQALLCAANVLNSLLGLILGHGFCQTEVSPGSD